ncbi:type II toxin-antitoxin system Phd/YefM family antitoxin [Ensifer adhaerens]|jgi:prevent-host-death family protein|uniref:type II toxin-antitoxin system Phd/YefM family antitoxin n=1 Tax=Ensifer adhaerens TaxID=106592 RepID=UPI002030930B|nr:type II toxin-antitoxin system prevent-host-death family antitoxin [Ensifer adhaerens]
MPNNSFLAAEYPLADLGEEEALQLSEARASFTKLVGQAEKQQRSVIMKHGKPVAAIVPLADLERLRALDLERRKKMVFRQPEDNKMADFVGEQPDSALALHQEAINALAAAIMDVVAKDQNLRSLLSKDLLAQGFVEVEEREPDRMVRVQPQAMEQY